MVRQSTLSIRDALIVSVICFGLSIFWSVRAVLAGFPDAPFSDSGMVWMLGTELVLALAALTFLRARGFDIAMADGVVASPSAARWVRFSMLSMLASNFSPSLI